MLTLHFADDDTTKEQFHCDDCGICRVGGRSKFFHCRWVQLTSAASATLASSLLLLTSHMSSSIGVHSANTQPLHGGLHV